MKKGNRKLPFTIILIGVIITMAMFLVYALIPSREIDDEKSFSLERIKEIQVLMENEAIHVKQTEGGNVKFHLYGKSKADVKLMVESDGDKIVINDNRFIVRPANQLVLDIYIPKDYHGNLAIRATSGNTRIDSLQVSNFSLNSSSGKVEIGKISADKMELVSTSGDISIQECSAKETRIKTSSGKANAVYGKFDHGSIHIETTSGNIAISLPSTAEFLLKAQSTSGQIENEFAFGAGKGNGAKVIEEQIGTKNNEVTLKCTSGKIKVLKK